ncbi:MAG: hypothetical protein IPJ88_04170 [Myxococcales bacterium]|nr:MAG: hypothetical protein IPJ88_04170 [Myxococcales bacterium]
MRYRTYRHLCSPVAALISLHSKPNTQSKLVSQTPSSAVKAPLSEAIEWLSVVGVHAVIDTSNKMIVVSP